MHKHAYIIYTTLLPTHSLHGYEVHKFLRNNIIIISLRGLFHTKLASPFEFDELLGDHLIQCSQSTGTGQVTATFVSNVIGYC